MAHTASQAKPKLTYAISYGFLSGPALSRQLRKDLRGFGYEEARGIGQADIIIAHSAGCWLVPKAASAKLLIHVGMPLAQAHPHETFKAARQQNIRAFIRHFHVWRGLVIGFYSLYYALAQPVRNRNIVRDAKHARIATQLGNVQTVFIANRDDPWPQPDKLQTYVEKQDWAFIGLPGSHNDIWEYPERYAAIIDHYARLLA